MTCKSCENLGTTCSNCRIIGLVEASSLGTPEAKALRASVSDAEVARVMARVREPESETSRED